MVFTPKAMAQAVTAALNAKQVPQFFNALPNPLDPGFIWAPDAGTADAYTIEIQQFSQNLGLGTGVPTTVWGYGKAGQPGTFPGRTFEVHQGTPITVTYVNALKDGAGNPLPNRMPVDTTLDWANPGAVGGLTPVPAVAHLHGGDSQYLSDGLPDAWGTPCAETPAPTGCAGALAPQAGRLFSRPYIYENQQEAGTLWYHDHALGITRTNVYMGLAGFYILRDANEDALRAAGVLPSLPYEIPVVIQDRMFTANSELFYPSSAQGNLPNPTHLPEFFGNVVLVNGQAWPAKTVEPRKYRLRVLNGSDSRFYDMRFEVFRRDSQIQPGKGALLPILVIGDELGLLDRPATPTLDTPVGGVRTGAPNVLAIGPGERYDVIVDFSQIGPNFRVVVTNTARSPYPDAGLPENNLTDRLMAFDVTLGLSATPNASVDIGTNLRAVSGPLPIPSTRNVPVRRILLFEGTDALGRLQTMLGPVDPDPVTGQVGTLTFKDPITERPRFNRTEIWEFYNTTVDAHPLHMHLVDFRILDRQTFTGTLTPKVNSDGSNGAILNGASIVKTGTPLAVSAWESGKKDTVKLFPGEVTRVLVSFTRRGEYVYHCHILSHEDHEMMRPYEVI
ncbi:MAG TPA: multicopper oxidase domain-containing protein [Burkholderiales bacterium]|nr:multicopper oxidase domain-containing protein [Burkholderiales bacterium]